MPDTESGQTTAPTRVDQIKVLNAQRKEWIERLNKELKDIREALSELGAPDDMLVSKKAGRPRGSKSKPKEAATS